MEGGYGLRGEGVATPWWGVGVGIPPSPCFSDNRKTTPPTKAPQEAQAQPMSDRGVGTPSTPWVLGVGGGCLSKIRKGGGEYALRGVGVGIPPV